MLNPQEIGLITEQIDALKTRIKNDETSLQVTDPAARTHKDPKVYEESIVTCKAEILQLQNMLDHPESYTMPGAITSEVLHAVELRVDGHDTDIQKLEAELDSVKVSDSDIEAMKQGITNLNSVLDSLQTLSAGLPTLISDVNLLKADVSALKNKANIPPAPPAAV